MKIWIEFTLPAKTPAARVPLGATIVEATAEAITLRTQVDQTLKLSWIAQQFPNARFLPASEQD